MTYMYPATLACFVAASSRHFRLARMERFRRLYRSYWPSIVNLDPANNSDWSLKARFGSFINCATHGTLSLSCTYQLQRIYLTPVDRSYWLDVQGIFTKKGADPISICKLLMDFASPVYLLIQLSHVLMAHVGLSQAVELYIKRERIHALYHNVDRDTKLDEFISSYADYYPQRVRIETPTLRPHDHPMLSRFAIGHMFSDDKQYFQPPRPSVLEAFSRRQPEPACHYKSTTTPPARVATLADFGLTEQRHTPRNAQKNRHK